MKKYQSFVFKVLFTCFCYVFVLSCNKTDILPDNNGSSSTTHTPLKLDKEIYDSETKQYTYNANGQCIRIDLNQSSISYSYRGTSVIETITYTDPAKGKIVKTYTLNNLGLAATCTYSTDTKSYLIEYEYNSNKQPTKITHKSNTVAKPTYYTDLTQIYEYNSDGDCNSYKYQLTFTNVWFQYEYDKTRFNTTGNEYKGLDWLGKSSKHVRSLMITTTGFYPPDWNSKTEFTNYNWTYDAQGYNKQYILSGASQSTAKFTYK